MAGKYRNSLAELLVQRLYIPMDIHSNGPISVNKMEGNGMADGN